MVSGCDIDKLGESGAFVLDGKDIRLAVGDGRNRAHGYTQRDLPVQPQPEGTKALGGAAPARSLHACYLGMLATHWIGYLHQSNEPDTVTVKSNMLYHYVFGALAYLSSCAWIKQIRETDFEE